jgi:hypothetical protein
MIFKVIFENIYGQTVDSRTGLAYLHYEGNEYPYIHYFDSVETAFSFLADVISTFETCAGSIYSGDRLICRLLPEDIHRPK